MTNPETTLEEHPLCWVFLYPAEGFEHDCHIIPENDLELHMISSDCWCHPVDDHEAHEYVWAHNAKDGREAYQDGIRKPS